MRRKRAPNLHNLIKRLTSPSKAVAATPSKKHTGSCVNDVSEVMHEEEMDSDRESVLDNTPRNSQGEMDHEWQDSCDVDTSELEPVTYSGATKRTRQTRSSSQLDVDPVSIMSPKDTPIPSGSGSKRKCVPQRRLLHDLRLATNRDLASRSPGASEQNMEYRMRPVDLHPGDKKSAKSDDECPEHEDTPQTGLECYTAPSGGPASREAAFAEETPVNQRAVGKTRSKGRRPDIGGVIKSLQAGQELGVDTPRSEVPYTEITLTSTLKEDETKQHKASSSPVGGPDENVDCKGADDKEDKIEGEEGRAENEDMREETKDTATSRDSAETEYKVKRSTRGQTERLTNKQPVLRGQRDKHEYKEMTQPETLQAPKKPETIINRWIIKPVPSCKGVCVEGHRIGDKEDQFWHSTSIMVRITPRLLATKSGALYRLAGKMDRALTMEQGFSESLVRSFQKGFPANWRELLYNHYLNEEKKKEQQKWSSSLVEKEPLGVTPGPRRSDVTVPDSLQKGKKKNPIEVTPQNLRVKDLRRSSSGRLIKPPLAYWTGQRVRHNTSLDVVEILLGSEDCTSSSINQISLQDSLELGPREKRAIKRSANTSKLHASSAGRKHRRQLKTEHSGADEEGSSCLDPEAKTSKGDGEYGHGAKLPASERKSKHSPRGTGPKRGDRRRIVQLKGTITDSSDNMEVPASKRHDDEDPLVLKSRRKSRYPRKNLKNRWREELQGSAESCSLDYPVADVETDNTASTSSVKPLEDPEINEVKHKKNERVKIQLSSQRQGSRQPPPPKKERARRDKGRVSSQPQPRACISPLYYQFSPPSEVESSHPASQPALGKTPTSRWKNIGDASSSIVGCASDLEKNSESRGRKVTNEEGEKMKLSRGDGSGESLGSLNLQEEILAVVEKHKQGRIARMRERSSKIRAPSTRDQSSVGKLPSASDVYELSDDEEDEPIKPKRVPYVPHGASTNTTTGESVSNWSEEGDKSVNMTWVTRAKPYRRIYGTLEDPQYRTDETSTETTTITTTTTGETDDSIVNPLNSDRETTTTKSSCDEEALMLQTRGQKKMLSTRQKGTRARMVSRPVLDQTSEDEQDQLSQKPFTSRSLKRTKQKCTPPETSSEDTDNTLEGQDAAISPRQQAASEDTDETVKVLDGPMQRGRSKKAIVIQRHQPRRNCKKSGSESDSHQPVKEARKPAAQSRKKPAPSRRKGLLEQSLEETTSECERWIPGQNGKGKVGSDTTSRDAHGTRRGAPRRLDVEAEPVRGTSRIEADGKSEFENKMGVHQKDEPAHPRSAIESSATKHSKQQSKQQANHAQAAIVLTAKVGTMKRKRQLRDLVEQHNRGYEDDIFDSTPFKKQKKLKIPLGEWDTEEDSHEGSVGKTPGSARFKTPSLRYQGVLPLSDKKTPYSNLISPGLLPSVDRKHVDQYIYGLQKKKKGHGLVQRPYTTKKPTGVSGSKGKPGRTSFTRALADKAGDMFDVTPVSDSDPDEDHDYYWSDEEH
ncbi:uncharacterized protein LOC110985020 [Acanthaster planci]|uniref:Uncharacterized protein LOC110985020 n=1 Tax=Acanthaster planci TaxID=133434 RepID=A0A8B7Z9B4_ACAPL|nr:uncharacterized protein LOC110985020 [Acanthaster planci]XP_022101401.1 uncharacterized protein LOC110985020 [Acanthaster planci]